MLSISDQILDGRNRCPSHVLLYPKATDYCDTNNLCDRCQEEYWLGYTTAQRYYYPYRNDVHFPEEEKWRNRWVGDLLRSSDRRKRYWEGYCEYAREMVGRCSRSREERESVLNAREKLSRKLGPREFTFTYSPSWFESDKEAQSAMKLAIERLTKYYKKEIIEFHAVGEYTANGASHVHAWYHLIGGHKISDKNFKRAYPRWNPKKKLGRGFEGGHHETITRTADFAGYIEKHLEEAWLVVDINADSEEEVSNASSSCGSPSSQSSEA